MDVLHHNLETVEGTCFSPTNFVCKVYDKVLIHDTVTGCKESKNVLEEVLLIIIELLPVFEILSKIDFFSCPKGSCMLFVHPPNIIVLNWEEYEPIEILLHHRFDEFM